VLLCEGVWGGEWGTLLSVFQHVQDV